MIAPDHDQRLQGSERGIAALAAAGDDPGSAARCGRTRLSAQASAMWGRASSCLRSSSSSSTRGGVSGNSWTRFPIAFATAQAMVAPTFRIGTSPAPFVPRGPIEGAPWPWGPIQATSSRPTFRKFRSCWTSSSEALLPPSSVLFLDCPALRCVRCKSGLYYPR
jgi:hypothetical protein